jgi:hypothetical protein
MNMGMTALQDQLARQHEPPTPEQRERIQRHPLDSAHLLSRGGVEDPVWLRLVQEHHETPDGLGYPAGKTGLHLAQCLLHQTDLLVARISPRALRGALMPRQEVLYYYLDCAEPERALGELLVTTLTLYPPGSYVQLKSGEKAVVLRRGDHINQPWVLALVNPKGALLPLPVVRDTRLSAHSVVAALPADAVRMRLDPSRILKRA